MTQGVLVDPTEFTPEEVKQLLEGLFLWHHHGNVDHLEILGENLGYPVLLTTMSAIQFVASLCFADSQTLDPLDAYFDRYMKRVDERYGIRFRLNMKRTGKRKSSDKWTLLDSGREYTNTGTILREALRNRLTHSCGSLLEIDARKTMEYLHMAIRRTHPGGYTLFIHAYRLYHDYRESLVHYYNDLSQDRILLRTTTKQLGEEWARIGLMQKAVDEVISDHLDASDSDAHVEKLVCYEATLQKLQEFAMSLVESTE
jgi:hypothetical protein